jgi:hypothetical protein
MRYLLRFIIEVLIITVFLKLRLLYLFYCLLLGYILFFPYHFLMLQSLEQITNINIGLFLVIVLSPIGFRQRILFLTSLDFPLHNLIEVILGRYLLLLIPTLLFALLPPHLKHAVPVPAPRNFHPILILSRTRLRHNLQIMVVPHFRQLCALRDPLYVLHEGLAVRLLRCFLLFLLFEFLIAQEVGSGFVAFQDLLSLRDAQCLVRLHAVVGC